MVKPNQIKSLQDYVRQKYPAAKLKKIKNDIGSPHGKYMWMIDIGLKPEHGMRVKGISYESSFMSWFDTAYSIKQEEEINKFLTPERQNELLDYIKKPTADGTK